MSLFNTVTLTVTPRTSGSYVNGRWANETSGTPFTVIGSVQPADLKEVQALPEERREHSVLRLYTQTELHSLSSTKNPDRISIDGKNYEVFKKGAFSNGIIPHYKYLLTEVV